MAGPLPAANKRRRNAPVIPSSTLPASGRRGRAPAVPKAYGLKTAGRAWWNWAWKLPQAVKWDAGTLYFVARRAQLEDDLVALDQAEGFNVRDLIVDFDDDLKGERELGKHIEFLIRRLKGLAGGRVGVMKEMRELDNRLGLNPKAMADLRWTIEETAPPTKSKRAKVARMDDYRKRLG